MQRTTKVPPVAAEAATWNDVYVKATFAGAVVISQTEVKVAVTVTGAVVVAARTNPGAATSTAERAMQAMRLMDFMQGS